MDVSKQTGSEMADSTQAKKKNLSIHLQISMTIGKLKHG